jgi:hypothetical protein
VGGGAAKGHSGSLGQSVMSEQPMPTEGRQDVPPIVRERFLATLAAQEAKGQAKYGRGLQTHNGRDAGQDAWEELVDLAQYLTQLRLERNDLLTENARLSAEIGALQTALASIGRSIESTMPVGQFSILLAEHRTATGLSINALARAAKIDPAHAYRLERGEARASRHCVVMLAGALRLSGDEMNDLLRAAGFAADRLAAREAVAR